VYDAADTSIRHRFQLIELGLTFLGEITAGGAPGGHKLRGWLLDRRRFRRSRLRNSNENAPWEESSHPEMNLGFQLVRSQLSLARDKRSTLRIAVTSALPGEGKTTLSKGLADAYANSGVRTLLIDAHFDNATLSRSHGASDKGGLLEVLLEVCEASSCITSGGEGTPDFLPAGRNLGGKVRLRNANDRGLEELMERLVGTYDVVIFDSAPLSNPCAIAGNPTAGGIILVCEHGRSTKAVLQDGLHLLTARSSILGAVINKRPAKT
jgi:Mrp family chromosome partitioning ATPase